MLAFIQTHRNPLQTAKVTQSLSVFHLDPVKFSPICTNLGKSTLITLSVTSSWKGAHLNGKESKGEKGLPQVG